MNSKDVVGRLDGKGNVSGGVAGSLRDAKRAGIEGKVNNHTLNCNVEREDIGESIARE